MPQEILAECESRLIIFQQLIEQAKQTEPKLLEFFGGTNEATRMVAEIRTCMETDKKCKTLYNKLTKATSGLQNYVVDELEAEYEVPSQESIEAFTKGAQVDTKALFNIAIVNTFFLSLCIS